MIFESLKDKNKKSKLKEGKRKSEKKREQEISWREKKGEVCGMKKKEKKKLFLMMNCSRRFSEKKKAKTRKN